MTDPSHADKHTTGYEGDQGADEERVKSLIHSIERKRKMPNKPRDPLHKDRPDELRIRIVEDE
jgi:hypothetical protein